VYNDYYKNQDDTMMITEIKKIYEKLINAGKGPDKCIRCGQCEEKCPQQLPIRNLLSRANMTLARAS
jgi:predicted aldo/keto reductase-like oxidoreductase